MITYRQVMCFPRIAYTVYEENRKIMQHDQICKPKFQPTDAASTPVPHSKLLNKKTYPFPPTSFINLSDAGVSAFAVL